MDETDNKKTICLNMIVKDEGHIIESTLINILEHVNIDYWVISDTGSSDDTIDIINKFFESRSIPGELHEDKWVDFGTNRTIALDYAFNKTDYVLFFDADDLIVGDFKLPELMDKDAYLIKFGNGVKWTRYALVSNRIKWKWVGVMHEFIQCCHTDISTESINGDYYFDGRHMGARSKNPNKYLDDALILEKAYKEETTSLKDRYSYYCGQCFSGAGDHDKAIEWYNIALQTKLSSDYKFVTCINIGNIYSDFLKNNEQAVLYWMKSLEHDPSRIEGISKVCEYFYNKGSHFMVNSLYERIKGYTIFDTHDKLFSDPTKYYTLEYYNSISAFYCNNKESGYECCKKLLLANKYIDITCSNIRFYKSILESDEDDSLLLWFCDYIEKTNNAFDTEKALKLFKEYETIIKTRLITKHEYLSDILNDEANENIRLIISQTNASIETVKEHLAKNNDDIVNTILSISQENSNTSV